MVTQTDSLFTAMEIFQDPVKRTQYDSVDPNADVDPPSKKAKGSIYKLWNPVFDAEGRFSKNKPVPRFGDDKSTKQEVESFYNFWYNFDSWRTFEYLDEDVPDDNESRDQKRHVERKNKAQRAKRKTEDTARLRKLVDDVLSIDTRIKKFKQEERLQKDAKKIAREAEEKKAAEAAELKAKEEAKKKEEEELAAKASKLDSKKAKEAAKNAAKKNKRALRKSVEDCQYFVTEGSASASVITDVLADVETIIAKVDAEELSILAKKLEGTKGAEATKAAFKEQADTLVEKSSAKESDFKTLYT